MKINENVKIVGEKVILVPYEAKHVERWVYNIQGVPKVYDISYFHGFHIQIIKLFTGQLVFYKIYNCSTSKIAYKTIKILQYPWFIYQWNV